MIAFEPLDAPLGALVTGFDPTAEPTDALISSLATGLADHAVLVFRVGPIEPDQFVRLGRAFGELEILPEPDKRHPDHPEIFNLTNVKPDGEIVEFEEPQAVFLRGTERWHTDSSFRQLPCLCTMLYAVEVPETGSSTEFADMVAAFEALPTSQQDELSGLNLVHSYEYSRANNPGELEAMNDEERAKYPPVAHPWVRSHSDGRRSLYMGGHASHIDGVDVQAGRQRIAALTEQVTTAAVIYEHTWQQHDLVVWDNRTTLHRLRPYDISNQRRVMRRITVANSEPVT